jgi:hypothetical protein
MAARDCHALVLPRAAVARRRPGKGGKQSRSRWRIEGCLLRRHWVSRCPAKDSWEGHSARLGRLLGFGEHAAVGAAAIEVPILAGSAREMFGQALGTIVRSAAGGAEKIAGSVGGRPRKNLKVVWDIAKEGLVK